MTIEASIDVAKFINNQGARARTISTAVSVKLASLTPASARISSLFSF